MSYKKYIKRGDKTFGPYIYHSKKVDGKVISEYQGKYEKKSSKKIWIFISISLVLLLSLLFIANYNSDEINFQSLDSAKDFFSKSIHSLTGFDILDSNNSEENNSAENIIPQQNITEENSSITQTINETENATINESPIINEIINESLTNFSINETNITDINITGNITETNITELNITNETVTNITEIANATISTIQLTQQITLGQPVKWKKQINPESSGNLTITLPEQADKIEVKKISENVEENITSQISITGAVIGSRNFLSGFIEKIFGAITGKAIDEFPVSEKEVEIQIDEPNASYEVQYETPAPYAVEEEKPNGKTITIVGPDTIHYQDVLAFTGLNENLGIKNPSSVKIHWIENNTYLNPSSIQDLDSNGIYDYVEWNVPHLSNQTFEIIVITKAEHLDSNRNFISDIYEQVRSLDDVWSETIPENDYVRITFEQNLTSDNDITIYPRVVSGTPTIEVYENNDTNLIAAFNPINSNEYNKVFLTNLQGTQDTFDLKVVGGSVEFDYIVDPSVNATSVQQYYFAMAVNTTNTSYLPFAGGQTGINAVPFATVALNNLNVTEDFWRSYLVDVFFNSTGVIVNRTRSNMVPLNVSVYVVQFGTNAVRVQNGTFSFTSAFTNATIATPVNLSATGLVFYYASTDATDDYSDNSVKGDFINTTMLNFSVDPAGTTGVKTGRWYAFESLDGGFTVQNVTMNLAAVTSQSASINSINTAKTFLIASYSTNENDDDPRDGSFNISLASATSVIIRRASGAASTINATVFAITFTGDESVQRGNFSYAQAAETATAVISAINTSMSMPWNSVVAGRMGSVGITDAAHSAFQMLNITNSTGVTGLRTNTTNVAGGTWEVIQWVAANATTAPQWFTPSTNNSNPAPNTNQVVLHNINWTDNQRLNYITLEINSTGANCDTPANVTSTTVIGFSSWVNLSWQIPNACEGKTIGWKQYANDTSNNWNVTNLQTYNVQNVYPIVTFGTNPANNSNSSSSSVTFDLKVSDNLGVDYLNLYGNWSGSWAVNQTNSSPFNDTFWNVTVTGIPDGRYVWAGWGNDTIGNSNFTTTNRTLAVDTTSPVITFLNKFPSDINQTTVQDSTINYSMIDNITGINSSSARLYYKTNSTDHSYWLIINGTVYFTDYTSKNMSNIGENYSGTIIDHDVFPGIYNWNQSLVESYSKGGIVLNATAQYISIELLNFSSTEQNNFIMINAARIAGAGTLRGYYCNSSYGFTTSPATNSSCTQFTAWPTDSTDYENIPFSLNVSSGLINTVRATNKSYFIFRGEVGATDWNISYITNISRNGATRFSINNGATYTNQSFTLDAHVHQFEGNDTFYYYACANNTVNITGCSSIRSDILQAGNMSPTTPIVLNPTNTTYNQSTNIIINWTQSISFNDYQITYNISLLNTDDSFNKTINSSIINRTNITYNLTDVGSFRVLVNATDSNGLASWDISDVFTVRDAINPLIDYGTNVAANNSNVSRNWVFVNVSYIELHPVNITFTISNQTGTWNSTTYTTPNNATNTSINFTNLADGTYDYNATLVDVDGNSNTTQNRRITLDTTIPQILFTTGTETNATSKNQNFVFANVSITEINFKNITYTLQNASGIVNQTTYTTYINQTNWTNLNNTNVQYWYNVTIYDIANNYNQTETRYLTLISNQAPIVTIFYPENTTYTIDVTQLNYTATDDNAVSYCWYSLNGGASNSTPSATCQNFTGLVSNEGSNNWNVYANDSAGLVGSDSVIFTKDTIKPNVQFVTRTTATGNFSQNYIEANVSASDSGTGLNMTRIFLYNSTAIVRSSINTSPYNFTNFTGLIDGTYFLNATANDSAGNENQTETRTILLDTTNPAVLLYFPANSTNSTTTSNTFIANVSDNIFIRNVSLLINGTINQTNTSGFNGTAYSFNVNLPDGFWNWSYQVYDYTNNSNTTTARWISVDTIIPQILFTTGTENNATTFARNWIFANVSVTETNQHTITFSLYNLTSLVNRTSYITPVRTINWTSLPNTNYRYNVTINDTSNNQNSTETKYIILDTQGPSVSTLTEFPADPATYSEGGVYRFNATIVDPSLDTVIFGFNNVNYTTTNVAGNIYNATITNLTVGTYNYRWYANDTFGNMNSTETGTYTINKANPPLVLAITPSASEAYGTETTANGSGCPSQLTCNLYRNSVNVTNPNIAILAVGVYNYTYNTTGNANYTAVSSSQNLTINKATGIVFTYVDNLRANKTIEQFTAIYLNGTLENGTGAIKLYNNGTLINQGTSPLSNLTNFTATGLYNITTTYDGNANYTASSETWWVNVTPIDTIPPQINLTNPLNRTYNATQTTLNYTASDNIGLVACWYSLNNGTTNTTITCGQNVTGLNSGEGTSTWKVYANDSRGNQNSSNVTFFVDSITPAISFAFPTEGNASQLTRNYIQVNVSASDTSLNNITIRLYNSSNSLIRQNSSVPSPFFINYTGLASGNYSFNATVNDTANNQNSTETRIVSLITPTTNITKPENETYINGNNLQLNFTASNQDYVWYRIDAGSNTTITTNITFNTTAGPHTLYLFANNSNGETAKNVTFTVNLTKFIVIYNNYTAEGSTTNFNSSSFEDLQNLSGIILEKTSYGKIQFSEAINVTNDSNISDNLVDLDNNTRISPNLIELNSTAIPNFNKSATLFLYGLTFSNPRILRNGELCPLEICTQQSYSSGTLVFTVTQFSNYSAEESPAAAIVAGGAGGKKTPQYECIDDSQCTDGKVCWENQCVKLFDVKIIDFKSPVKLGDFFEFTYYMKGQADINNDVIVNFWIEKDGKKVTTGSDTIYMGTFDEKTETTKIFLPTTLESGVYEFFVEVYFEKYHANSHRTIQIEVKNGVATITNVESNITLYLILGSILLVLILFFIVYLKRKTRKSEKPFERKPVEIIKEISRKELPLVEKKVHEKTHLLRNIFAKIKVASLRVKYIFTSIKARHEANLYKKRAEKVVVLKKLPQVERKVHEESHLLKDISVKIKVLFSRIKYFFTSLKPKYEAGIYKKKAEKIIPKKAPQTKETPEENYLLESILEKIKVALLRIKYLFTSIKPKYEAGVYKKEISEIEHLTEKIFKPIKPQIKKISRKKPESIRQKKEPVKQNKGSKRGPKTVGEIIEELKEENEKNN